MKLTIWLPGYLTPSQNKTHHAHWTTVYKHKKQAQTALLSALSDARCVSWTTGGTMSEEQKTLLIASAARNLYQATLTKKSISSARGKPKSPRKTSAHSSKSNTMTKEELFKAALDRLFDEVFGPYTGATRWITAQENMNKKEELRQNNSLREKAIEAIVDEQRKTNQLLSNLLELLSKQKPGDPPKPEVVWPRVP